MVRLNKFIADSGLCSRRQADTFIEAGRVRVNGQKIQEMGTQVDPAKDKITVDGKPLPRKKEFYLLFHKPKGVITTRSDEKDRQTIYDCLAKKYQACDPAGRLDRDSSGALILTTDGDFLYQLTHPKFHVEKKYRVTVKRPYSDEAMEALKKGVLLEPENKLAQATHIERIDEKTMVMTLITGYNRQIRRMLMTLGYEVTRLKRIAIGSVELDSLGPGRVRPLTKKEIDVFRLKKR